MIDFTGVQAGPSCTQMLAWFGADVVKIELPGKGDVTRGQLRDIPDQDGLYFTMLNSNKRSLELNTKTVEGKKILEQMIVGADIFVENFAPGALERMGFTWEHLHELNPRLIYGTVKGFPENSPYNDLKVYEDIAQCAGGAASTTGLVDGTPLISAAALGDSNTGMHLLIGLLAALLHREKTGKGQRVYMSMQDAVMNLVRVKIRDQQRLERTGELTEYPQYPHTPFSDTVPRGGNASGSGVPGWMLKCKNWQTDPNDYMYIILQPWGWEHVCAVIGKPEWVTDPAFATQDARKSHIFDVFDAIEAWLADKDKHEAVEILRKLEIPCGPILTTKELLHDPSLRENGSIVEVEHKGRGSYLTVGCPPKFSAFTPKITGSPLLGEHNHEILVGLGYDDAQIADFKEKGVI
ncbi:formyl-CoA transferase [Sphingomonas abietis]|uniref:Formyl-CoA:oxalate CoA-transferase n=1 Tax=Sphingomonas abietis TaxID=3012344 RepID=A0ABY7NSM3_9SPHN|nr:formyl-CoA transferase [Sphingomonas abietis]WBO24505.1 formyl-CoA transferase [Sphingomonas abietis]